MHAVGPLIVIGKYGYDKEKNQLFQLDDASVKIKLEPRLVQLLDYFLAHPDQIVSKDQLLDQVWPENEGSDAAVTRAVATLRKLLLPALDGQPCIETLSKRGYRWTFAVTVLAEWPSQKNSFVSIAQKLEEPVEPATIDSAAIQPVQAQASLGAWLAACFKSTPWFLPLVGIFCLTLALLWFGWRMASAPHSALPVYSQQVSLSALTGDEMAPLFHPEKALLYYQYQPSQQLWRWLQHDLQTNQLRHAPQQFTKMSQGVQIDGQHMVFQAVNQDGCQFYRAALTQLEQAAIPVLACDELVKHGLTLHEQTLYWLALSKEQQFEVRRRPVAAFLQPSDAVDDVLIQFPSHYRRATHLHAHGQFLYVILEHSEALSSMIRLHPDRAQQDWLMDLTQQVYQIRSWDHEHLLLTTSAGLMLYQLSSGRLQPLQTMLGNYRDAYPYNKQILAVNLLNGSTDIVPIESPHLPAVGKLSPWLNSHRHERHFITQQDRHAFVSNRSGYEQIWLWQQDRLVQLTEFKQPVRISQLLWHNQQLLAIVDAVLYQVQLTDGKLRRLQQQTHRAVSCHGQLYLTRRSVQGWHLDLYHAEDRRITLQPNVVDARCGADDKLILQTAQGEGLSIWSPQSDQDPIPLPIAVSWRHQAADSWLTTGNFIYWLAPSGLQRYHLQSKQIERIELTSVEQIQALYEAPNQQGLLYLKQQQLEADIVWLKSQR